jgi:hypothetical protein
MVHYANINMGFIYVRGLLVDWGQFRGGFGICPQAAETHGGEFFCLEHCFPADVPPHAVGKVFFDDAEIEKILKRLCTKHRLIF